ncbi:hypothetical protein L1987_49986 [Smallanthus sonchifolius]|uniref:Uncharacterized protein n=1 Tax=Smallanthus sonchifolius TaxID=185202 RepID=A0ACB9FW89_9ASTR|nr:hypothetical protein L1987_49986 [Smallanthus sonchifolius]
MASIDPSLISDPEENKWVVEIDEILDHQLEIDVETPYVSLFQILKTYEIKDYKLHVLNKVRKFVPVVRSCYDMFLQHDDDSLARIFAIDGLFLLMLFHTYNGPIDERHVYLATLAQIQNLGLDEAPKEIEVTAHNQIEWEKKLQVPHLQPELPKIGPKNRSLAQDIMMVENQIPFMVLKEIDETLQASLGSFSSSVDIFSNSVDNFSSSKFRIFCEIPSPLKLCSKSQAPSSVDHLLHYMYYSIVNNIPEQKPGDTLPDESHKIEKPDVRQGQPPFEERILSEPLNDFVTKIPVKEIIKAYEQTVSMLETFSQTKTIKIPSASTLHHKAGFQFHSLEDDEGIQNIRVRGNDIYLPMGLRAIGSFLESSWKIVAFTVILLTSQAYCDAYGCDKNTVTLLPYASS